MTDGENLSWEELHDQLLQQMKEIHSVARTAADEKEQCVTPVFRYDESGRPDLEGSGVLGHIDDQFYLVTAAHVLRVCEYGLGLPMASNEVKPLEYDGMMVGHRAKPGTRTDRVDVGFVRLNPQEVSDLGPHRFVDLTNNHAPPMKYETTLFICIGYPARDFRDDPATNSCTGEVMVFYTGGAEWRGYELARVDYDTHFLIRYRRQDIATHDSIGAPPDFRGMSGGGVWPFDILKKPGPDNPPCFAGIVIERPPRFARSFLVTRSSLIEAVIRCFDSG